MKRLKRLTDVEVGRDQSTLDLYIPQHTPPRMARERLYGDHLQAREDVKRLAAALKARLVDCCGKPDTTGRCAWCLRDAELLRKVGQ